MIRARRGIGLSCNMNKRYDPRLNALIARCLEAARLPTAVLNSVTLQHHALLDKLATRLTSRSIFFPHGFFEDGWGNKVTLTVPAAAGF